MGRIQSKQESPRSQLYDSHFDVYSVSVKFYI